MIERHLNAVVFQAKFGRQMRFIAGPRQAGKTTLARRQLEKQGCKNCYFNWDLRPVRSLYRENPLFYWQSCLSAKPLGEKYWVCFDEIHKMPRWKNILKGAFDEKEREVQFIVTGSARLDWFQKSGDSLAGRYFLFHLMPVTLREINGSPPPVPTQSALEFIEERLAAGRNAAGSIENLLRFSGFPEPFTRQSPTFYKRWQEAYTDQLIREDLRDLTRIRELEHAATLSQILPSRIGSPLSVRSLQEELEVSYNAVKNYLKALELSYAIFLLTPYTRKIARAVKKEKKAYLYDWGRVQEASFRYENFIAVELQALISLWNDRGLGPFTLHYVRTRDGKETDFLIARDQKPWLLLEAKLARASIAAHHFHHAKHLGGVPYIELVAEEGVAQRREGNAWIISASRFLG